MEFFEFVVILIFVTCVGQYMSAGLWLQARSAGVPVGMLHLTTMRLRGVEPRLVVLPLIMGRQAGLAITEHHLEAHYLAGGDLNNVIKALIEAHRAGIELDFHRAAAIDLAGRDVLDAIAMMVNPKVLQTQPVSGMAKDGIQVTAKCRVTLKANIEGLVGGAGEDTILARVGQGIVTAIGSASTHKRILENPGLISRQVLDIGLDRDTAFEIISIDVMDLDIGRNIGAQLQMDRAEADKQIAQAHAEERRAEAVAQEEEYKAKAEEMRAKVVEEESRVPRALAAAIRGGKFKSAAH